MNPGNFRTLIMVQKKYLTYNTYNEPIEIWKDSIELWADVITTGGSEFYAAQKLNAATTAVFRTRYVPGIEVIDRIKYGNRIFEILPPVNDVNEKHIELLISAKEVV
jgi:SPP1 family predicted phage head-tail adaptor